LTNTLAKFSTAAELVKVELPYIFRIMSDIPETSATDTTQGQKSSFVKLAMRNMVRKRGTSIYHFALTTIGLLGTLVVLSYLTR